MAAIDAAAPEPVEVLIERAGFAVARAARGLLGGSYGRRVLVIAGKGNNGNDGQVAARLLARSGVRCLVVSPEASAGSLAYVDLVIDAAYGTGFVDRGEWNPPDLSSAPLVLAVDIVSGVSGQTGEAVPGVAAADQTVTFGALKPGLVLEPGRSLAGDVDVAPIGLDCSSARAWLVTAADVAQWVSARAADSHKWRAACWVIAGSSGMTGAAHLAVRGAQRSGAGYVRLSSPGVGFDPLAPTEAVGVPLPETGWARSVDAERFGAVVLGPGLGRAPGTAAEVRALASGLERPLVIDGDGLSALGKGASALLRNRTAPAVLTPHDGEFERLTGHRPGPDRLDEARALAAATRSVVLLKGPTTVVAEPGGEVLVVTEGDARLATAGTGDVLAGIIGALLARGVDGFTAAAAGAFLHGRAARLGVAEGLVAGDLADLLPAAWESLR